MPSLGRRTMRSAKFFRAMFQTRKCDNSPNAAKCERTMARYYESQKNNKKSTYSELGHRGALGDGMQTDVEVSREVRKQCICKYRPIIPADPPLGDAEGGNKTKSMQP